MNCPECSTAGKHVTMIFDGKQMGEVCPKCTLVISMFNGNPNHFHYATERGYKAKMKKDQDEKRAQSVSTAALVSRILRPID